MVRAAETNVVEGLLARASVGNAVTESAVNPRLLQRLEAWRTYKTGGGEMEMGEWVSHTQGAPWGTGFKSGYGDFLRSIESVHGNSLMSPRTAYLYRLETKGGDFLKWGISQDPYTRYSQTFMLKNNIRIFGQGTRAEMSALERYMVESQPGPLNLEPWAGRAR
jgi:hypothetical protein